MSADVPVTVKWGKETLELKVQPSAGAKALHAELEERTGVPRDRMKVMAKSKGLWKGVLKDSQDLTSLDWAGAQRKGIQLLLMGSATTLAKPKTKTVFLEDLPPEEQAKVAEPSGLVNLGNTCYLNSVLQCLRTVPNLRRGLVHYTPGQAANANGGAANAAAAGGGAALGGPSGGVAGPGAVLFVAALRDTLDKLDKQSQPYEPATLVQATRLAFPQFAQRGPQGQPMQQDAEEFLNGLMTILAHATKSNESVQSGFESGAKSEELSGADNLVDAVFGLKMKETLTCEEIDSEPPVESFDLARKLVCNIQGGGAAASNATSSSASGNVSHIDAGIALSLSGKIEKQSDVLGRNAMWTRQQRIARLPPILTVQFGRFFWKATPDSQDHAGVKCKVMKPVAFDATLDVYEFCTPEVKAVLKVARDKAAAAEEDRINKKLKGEEIAQGDAKKGDDDKMDIDKPVSEEKAEEDADLQAALAMSMETEEKPQSPVGPGLPADFQGVYELFAVVTHKGRDADGGHYMAWVKADRDPSAPAVQKIANTNTDNEDWYVFDDDEVSPCKTEDVLKLKGGGDWHMSYLNFYRAKK